MTVGFEDTLEIRVRYHETDGQGRVHHAQYINYFERGRVELLRSMGQSYRELEESGFMLVVSQMNVRYLGAAEFDDLLLLTTRVEQVRGVRIEHSYHIRKANPDGPASDVVEGTSVVACVDPTGKVRRLPPHLRT